MKKRDLFSILVLGEIIAISIIPFLIDTGLAVRLSSFVDLNVLFVLPVIIPVIALLSFWILGVLSRRIPIFFQIGKFAAVGISNTTIDFGLFSFLKFATGATLGLQVAGINIPGFSLAVVNSYLWNKFWTFRKTETREVSGEFLQFMVVSLVGVVLNSAVLFVVTTFIPPQFGLNESLWATAAKLFATPISLAWNFVGYKFVVFRK